MLLSRRNRTACLMAPPPLVSRAQSAPRETRAASKRSRWFPSSHAMETCGLGSCTAQFDVLACLSQTEPDTWISLMCVCVSCQELRVRRAQGNGSELGMNLNPEFQFLCFASTVHPFSRSCLLGVTETGVRTPKGYEAQPSPVSTLTPLGDVQERTVFYLVCTTNSHGKPRKRFQHEV